MWIYLSLKLFKRNPNRNADAACVNTGHGERPGRRIGPNIVKILKTEAADSVDKDRCTGHIYAAAIAVVSKDRLRGRIKKVRNIFTGVGKDQIVISYI